MTIWALRVVLVVALAAGPLACQETAFFDAETLHMLSEFSDADRVSQVPACVEPVEGSASGTEVSCGPSPTVDVD